MSALPLDHFKDHRGKRIMTRTLGEIDNGIAILSTLMRQHRFNAPLTAWKYEDDREGK